MEPSQQPAPVDPYELRPEEQWYFWGWVAFVAGGVYFIHRGLVQERTFWIIAGSVAILLGVSQAAVIAIRQLRPWRKVVGVTWTIIILLAFVGIYVLDFLGHPVLPR